MTHQDVFLNNHRQVFSTGIDLLQLQPTVSPNFLVNKRGFYS